MSLSPFIPAGVSVQYNVGMPMRDGIRLSADVFYPSTNKGPWPVILLRTPYDNVSDHLVEEAIFYAQHGYVYVAQDVRGRGDSDGQFYPWVHEFNDGYDSIEWLGTQNWCNGKIGMVGSSYAGNVQWQAAVGQSSFLKTIIPRVIGHNLYEAPHYQGGAFQLGWTATWIYRTDGRTNQPIDKHNWTHIFAKLPLEAIDKEGGKTIPYFQDWLSHPDYDTYWKELSIEHRYTDVKIPVFHIGGWYDFFSIGTLKNFSGMQSEGGNLKSRKNQKLLIGPWTHKINSFSYAGDLDFGMDSLIDLRSLELRWMNRWIKGDRNNIDAEPSVTRFVMGLNQWKDSAQWPIPGATHISYYLHSHGKAEHLDTEGQLSTELPGNELFDSFIYDPSSPVPTNGGCTCCNPEIVPYGAFNQISIEKRTDVLTYTTKPLKQDIEVTGTVYAEIYASSSAVDTDFTAKLVDLSTDGYAMNICDGIIRARYRESREYQTLMEPNKVYRFHINLGPTSNVFLKGHRIRLEISSSNFPRFDRNLNTGDKQHKTTNMRPAKQKVYHDVIHPSQLMIPLVKNS